MECAESRKKLQDYSRGAIKDEALLKDLESHIESCALCKHELYMWQELLSRQSRSGLRAPSGSFAERVNQHMRFINSDANIPPMARMVNDMNKSISSPKGCLVMQVIMVMLALAVIVLVRKGLGQQLNPLVMILFGVSLVCLIALLVRKK